MSELPRGATVRRDAGLYGYERALRRHGLTPIAGVDEAGRGALAGPVVAAAVLVSPEFLEGRWAVAKSGRVNDSKQLTAAEREVLWAEFEELVAQRQIHANYGVATVAEIESVNILGATKLAMRRALGGSTRRTMRQRNSTPRRPAIASRRSRIAACFPGPGNRPRVRAR